MPMFMVLAWHEMWHAPLPKRAQRQPFGSALRNFLAWKLCPIVRIVRACA